MVKFPNFSFYNSLAGWYREIIPKKKGEDVMRPLFVMVKCKLGHAYKVAEELVDEIEETSEVYSISGQYDLLVKFYIDEKEDIGRFICEKVQKLPNIQDTFTIQAYKAFKG